MALKGSTLRSPQFKVLWLKARWHYSIHYKMFHCRNIIHQSQMGVQVSLGFRFFVLRQRVQTWALGSAYYLLCYNTDTTSPSHTATVVQYYVSVENEVNKRHHSQAVVWCEIKVKSQGKKKKEASQKNPAKSKVLTALSLLTVLSSPV